MSEVTPNVETAETPPPAASVELRDFGVRVPGRNLLEGVDVDLPAGEISLIVGASGAGKSVFLNVLAGLVGRDHPSIETTGELHIGGEDRFAKRTRCEVGIVFQNFALFDELSAEQNVQFGSDHSRVSHGERRSATELLDELGVPRRVPVSLLSGGQKQRLAVARTLAFDPDIVVYDEPTSGLDPAGSIRIAERIRKTQAESGKTTIIVTHDYAFLAPIASAVFCLDPRERTLRQIDHEALGELESSMAATPAELEEADAKLAPPSWSRRLAGGVGRVLEQTSRTVEAAVLAAAQLVPRWKCPTWGLRYLRHYLGVLLSPSSLLYFAAAGVIAGLVSTHFTFKFLPFKAYTEPLITEELLQGLGFSLYRIIIPVLLTVLLAARGGAAIAADTGSRSYSRQIDALRSFGARPASYLLTNVLWASLLAAPVLTLLGFWVARWTSLAVFTYNYPEHTPLFWESHFHQGLRVPGTLLYEGTGWVVAKVLACAFGIGAISYFHGVRPKNSAPAVSRAITTTIIWATLHVLVVHFVFAFIEFE